MQAQLFACVSKLRAESGDGRVPFVTGSLTWRGTYGHLRREAARVSKLCAEGGDDGVAPHDVRLAVLQTQGGALVRCVGAVQRLLHLADGLRYRLLTARRHHAQRVEASV